MFGRLIEGFRGRLDREIAAFLAAKRAAAAALAGPEASAWPGGGVAAGGGPVSGRPAGPGGTVQPTDPTDPTDLTELTGLTPLIDGVGRLIAQGGKRLRPALVYYTYRACGGRSEEQVLPLALATELLHTYLLIHDDIMDHAEVRRGQPAAHVRFRDLHRAGGLRGDADDFGRSVAILLGDLAHTWAVELFTTATAHRRDASGGAAGTPAASPHDAAELSRCFSAMCEEVIGGQYLEYLLAHRAAGDGAEAKAPPLPQAALGAAPAAGGDERRREAELLRVLRLKSGRYTAERPIQLGALLAGASREARAELSRYGSAVGEAFQLQDDLLGVFGDPAVTGKPVGDDLREGKFTFLIHHALAKGGAADRQLVAAALGNAELTAAEVARVQQALERTGARRAVTAMVAERLANARRALAALPATLGLAAVYPADPEASASRAGAAAQREGALFLSGLLDFLWERER